MWRIGILTSGGDAPGLNAYLAFFRAMLNQAYGDQVKIFGFKYGYEGLCLDQWISVTSSLTTGIKRVAGSVLGCNKAFFFGADKAAAALATIKKHALNVLVVAGGDGTRRGLEKTLLPALEEDGYQLTLVHVSKSIDNNNASIRSIGYYTAAQEVMATFDKLNATAKTHRRYFLVEIMGDNSIELSLAAFEGGADIIVANLAKEKLTHEELVQKTATAIASCVLEGKNYGAVALMERTVTNGDQFAREVEEWIKQHYPDLVQTIRFIDPGHTLRGSIPDQRDRELASRFAFKTIEAITSGASGTVIYNAGRTQLVTFDNNEGLEAARKRRIRSVAQKLDVLRAAGCVLIGMPEKENIV